MSIAMIGGCYVPRCIETVPLSDECSIGITDDKYDRAIGSCLQRCVNGQTESITQCHAITSVISHLQVRG